jgi:mRNA-degrading endonuclease RelE of RelBE toxin-antitoxin system
MARRSKFTISYAPETYKHLDWIESKYHRLVATTIEERFPIRPQRRLETANRLKSPLRWVRLGNCVLGRKNSFRVFYDVNREEKIVSVLAIGVKEGNQLFIG